MTQILKIIPLVILSLFVLNTASSSASVVTKVKGSNTKLEADRGKRGVWKLSVCTRISVKQPQYVELKSKSPLVKKVLNMAQYGGTSVVPSRPNWWPGKDMRCYDYFVYTKALSKVRATWVRKVFESRGKIKIDVRIGVASGKITLNA